MPIVKQCAVFFPRVLRPWLRVASRHSLRVGERAFAIAKVQLLEYAHSRATERQRLSPQLSLHSDISLFSTPADPVCISVSLARARQGARQDPRLIDAIYTAGSRWHAVRGNSIMAMSWSSRFLAVAETSRFPTR